MIPAALADKIDLKIMHEGDPVLLNVYSLIALNPEKFSHVKYEETKLFIDWITSSDGQQLIENYKKNGKQYFHPSANRDEK